VLLSGAARSATTVTRFPDLAGSVVGVHHQVPLPRAISHLLTGTVTTDAAAEENARAAPEQTPAPP
jgi:hypothetical protein